MYVHLSVTILTGAAGTWRAKLRYQQKALDVANSATWCFMPQNWHPRVTSTVTRLLECQVHLAKNK